MNLFSRIYGNGSPMIILHGLFGMSDNWNSIGKQLAKYFQVHLLDLRNHGKSPHHIDFNYEVMMQDVIQYIDRFKLRKSIVLGHSLGGKIAMGLASNHSSLFKKIIVVDISPKEYDVDFHINILQILSNLNLKKYNSRKDIDNELEYKIKDRGVRLFLMKNLYRNEKKEFAWRFNIHTLRDEINNISTADFILEKTNLPTLFIKGENSSYITIDDYQEVKRYFPLSNIKIVKNAGHWVHAEEPIKFFKLVVDFLKDE